MSLPRHSEPASGGFDPQIGVAIRARRQAVGLTLKQLAGKAGCAASYLSLIENARRTSPPSDALLGRLEEALGMERGTLVAAARWDAAPIQLRREAAAARRQRFAASKLATLLRTPGGGGQPLTSLDELYRSGELKQLIEQLAPAEEAAPGELPLQRLLPAEVPLINSVAAGYPTEFTDLGYPARIAAEYVRTPDIKDPDAFAARVIGDSMEPLYRQGDIVVFSPSRQVASGMDCFVRVEPDHESTFKRVYFERAEGGGERAEGRGQRAESELEGEASGDDAAASQSRVGAGAPASGDWIRLQPLNPRYAARVLPREQVAGIYAAVSVTRSV